MILIALRQTCLSIQLSRRLPIPLAGGGHAQRPRTGSNRSGIRREPVTVRCSPLPAPAPLSQAKSATSGCQDRPEQKDTILTFKFISSPANMQAPSRATAELGDSAGRINLRQRCATAQQARHWQAAAAPAQQHPHQQRGQRQPPPAPQAGGRASARRTGGGWRTVPTAAAAAAAESRRPNARRSNSTARQAKGSCVGFKLMITQPWSSPIRF